MNAVKLMNMKNEIKLKISEIFETYLYEPASDETLQKVDLDISMLLYRKCGYESDYNSKNFKPLIPNVNYTITVEEVESEKSYLQLGILDNGVWNYYN